MVDCKQQCSIEVKSAAVCDGLLAWCNYLAVVNLTTLGIQKSLRVTCRNVCDVLTHRSMLEADLARVKLKNCLQLILT